MLLSLRRVVVNAALLPVRGVTIEASATPIAPVSKNIDAALMPHKQLGYFFANHWLRYTASLLSAHHPGAKR